MAPIRLCNVFSCATYGARRLRRRSCSFPITVCFNHSSTELVLTVSISLSCSKSISVRVAKSSRSKG